MDEAREREDKKQGHAQHQMRLEDRMHIQDIRRGIGLQCHDPLRPRHELHHLVAIEMTQRHENRRKPQQELREQIDAIVADLEGVKR